MESLPKAVSVGYVRHTHGLKGEIFIRLRDPGAPWLSRIGDDPLQLRDREGRIQPLQVRSARPHKDGFLAHPAGIERIEEAEPLVGHEVLIPEAWLVAKTGEAPFLFELLGFSVTDEEGAVRGKVVAFTNTGHQDLAEVLPADGGVRFYVPFVRALIVGIDYDKKEIRMKLPEGIDDLENL